MPPTEAGERIVLQLGAAGGVEALQAAQRAAADVRAIDLNMGCPVKFSTQGGMGSALLSEPERVRDILTTLRRNLPATLPVTAKIRLLDDFPETLALAKLIESCGVAALAVHARRRHDRPRHWAQWEQFKTLREAMPTSLPMILNGDIFAPADVPRALESSGACSLMPARGALWNPSLLGVLAGRPMRPQAEMIARYVELCEQTECPVGNAKYTAMLMLEGSGKTAPFKLFQRAKSLADLRAAAAACTGHEHFLRPGGEFCPAVLEPPPDLPGTVHLPINAWRPVPAFWTPGVASNRCKAAKMRALPAASCASAASGASAAPAAEGSAMAGAAPTSAGAAPSNPPSGAEPTELSTSGREVDATRTDRYGPRPLSSVTAAVAASAQKRTLDQASGSDCHE